MIKKFIALLIVIALVSGFILIGLPFLKQIKGDKSVLDRITSKTSGSDGKDNNSILPGRDVTVDITIENICHNIMTDEIYEKCINTTNCDSTCEKEGCNFFGLYYKSSNYQEKKCYCNCIEPNKIKKALGQDTP